MIEINRVEKHPTTGEYYAAVDPTVVPAGVARGHYYPPAIFVSGRPLATHRIEKHGPASDIRPGETLCWVRLQDLAAVEILDVHHRCADTYALVYSVDVPVGVLRSMDGVKSDDGHASQLCYHGPRTDGNHYPCWILLSDVPCVQRAASRTSPATPAQVSPVTPAQGQAAADLLLVSYYEQAQREDRVRGMSAADKERASAAWSAQLRAKVEASEVERRRLDREQVVCDDDRWEVD